MHQSRWPLIKCHCDVRVEFMVLISLVIIGTRIHFGTVVVVKC